MNGKRQENKSVKQLAIALAGDLITFFLRYQRQRQSATSAMLSSPGAENRKEKTSKYTRRRELWVVVCLCANKRKENIEWTMAEKKQQSRNEKRKKIHE